MTADLIAALAPQLSALVHPTTGQPLLIPTFRTATLPQGMREELAEQLGNSGNDIATTFLEALFHAVDGADYEIVTKAELQDMRAAASANEHKRNEIKAFHCRQCAAELFRAMITDFNTDKPAIDRTVIRALRNMDPDCSTGHQS